jgi:hypothetical protein
MRPCLYFFESQLNCHGVGKVDDDDDDNNDDNESRSTHRKLMIHNISTQISENTHADRCGNTS